LFYQAFPKCDALRHELSWTHYRLLLHVGDQAAHTWYRNEAADQNWSTRALDRQIGTLYYERLLASRDRKPVRDEAAEKLADLPITPREFVRDPVLLEFLGLPGTGNCWNRVWDPHPARCSAALLTCDDRTADGTNVLDGSKQFGELSQGGRRLRESLSFEGCEKFLDRRRRPPEALTLALRGDAHGLRRQVQQMGDVGAYAPVALVADRGVAPVRCESTRRGSGPSTSRGTGR
jgi:hypothetical protein